MKKDREMFRFQKLKIWQSSIELADQSFEIAEGLTRKRLFGFSEQLRKASLSIPNNIAEGAGRSSKVEFRRFLDIAKGSAYELVNMLILFTRRGYLQEKRRDPLLKDLQELVRMISGFRRKLEA